jgi:3-dehydroquinate dehydratase / shikimate dehydrogenase
VFVCLRGGGIGARLKRLRNGSRHPTGTDTTTLDEAPLHPPVEEALFAFMTMDTQLCITVTAPTMAELRARRDRHPAGALLELRLDTVDRPDVRGALAGRRGPVVVTCRASWEGGAFAGSEEERLRLLEEALTEGADFVDVEFAAAAPQFLTDAVRPRVVLSMHDFAGLPGDLDARVEAMRRTGAGVVKVAVLTPALADVVRLRDLALRSPRDAGAAAYIAMGEAGLVSRVLPERFGSCWTYAGEAAPGQLSLGRMLDEFGVRRIGQRTALYGLVGKPVGHSVSPAMHNAAFRAAHLDAVYLPLAAESMLDFFALADALGIQGVSVTAPQRSKNSWISPSAARSCRSARRSWPTC